LDLLTGVTYGIATIGVAVGAGSLVVRFRRARGVERQQLRWVAFGAALTAVAALIALAGVAVDATVGGAVAGATLLGNPVFLTAAGLCIAVLPLATGAAILRYRLYDLDRIISRTVAYGLLTVLLGLGYGAVVLGLGRLLPDSSSLTVAAATLAVAAAFQPARRRIQQAVDRRFNRRRYDVARTIGAFSARLRDQIDLGTLATELLAVVDQTMEPTQVTLWLRPETRLLGHSPQRGTANYLGLLGTAVHASGCTNPAPQVSNHLSDGPLAGPQPPAGPGRARTTPALPAPRPGRQVLPQLRRGVPLGGWRGAGDAGAGSQSERVRRALGVDGPRRVPGLAAGCRTWPSGAGPWGVSRARQRPSAAPGAPA
jgi:hypothetical protein